jgi:hypothetical protein
VVRKGLRVEIVHCSRCGTRTKRATMQTSNVRAWLSHPIVSAAVATVVGAALGIVIGWCTNAAMVEVRGWGWTGCGGRGEVVLGGRV